MSRVALRGVALCSVALRAVALGESLRSATAALLAERLGEALGCAAALLPSRLRERLHGAELRLAGALGTAKVLTRELAAVLLHDGGGHAHDDRVYLPARDEAQLFRLRLFPLPVELVLALLLPLLLLLLQPLRLLLLPLGLLLLLLDLGLLLLSLGLQLLRLLPLRGLLWLLRLWFW